MGEYAEYALEDQMRSCGAMDSNHTLGYRLDYSIWHTAGNCTVRICDMTIVHLANTINMLMRKMPQYDTEAKQIARQYIDVMTAEIRRKKHEMENKMKDIQLNVAGVTFTNTDGRSRQSIISNMTMNSAVWLQREPTNQYDVNAVAVFTIDGQIGYIAKDYAAILAPMMDRGEKFTARVKEVNTYKEKWYCHLFIDQQ